ncbi:unnamed protein product [Darwinula stevensoni]|uniref:ER membrane protein complex subunit 4 n=1 Tax=Darwinula stevensoni TaxID=69355 RepID=A0A7R9A8F0_9CRUS|nr:unnamed protein product [Darwinula stevensoni]CAG0896358.1 unnamed protein product [Darwinula stevensoni]
MGSFIPSVALGASLVYLYRGEMSVNTADRRVAKKFKWTMDFSSRKPPELASPPGFSTTPIQVPVEAQHQGDHHLIVKRSWDLALGPLKQLPMNAFILYMAGNSISIFPIMMVGMMLIRPVKALMTTQATFRMIEGSQSLLQKLVYILGNLACVGLGLYKCQSMGLLPTHASDWLAFLEPQERLEHSYGGIVYRT